MRSRWISALEVTALAVFSVLVSWITFRLCREVSGWSRAPLLLVAAVAGYAMADVASGLLHWFCDSFFREDTPGVGPLLIFPFREHHRDPAAMTQHGFLELTGNSALALLPLLGIVVVFPPPAAVRAGVLAFAFALLATNLFHKWAHSRTVPGWVARLQQFRLILRPEAHAAHHRPGNAGTYCVTSGWMNALLNRVLH